MPGLKRRWFVGQVSGVYSVTAPSGRSRGGGGEATMNLPYIRVVGINIEQEGRNRHNVEFSKVEEEEFTKMAKDSENDIYVRSPLSHIPQPQPQHSHRQHHHHRHHPCRNDRRLVISAAVAPVACSQKLGNIVLM